MMLLFIILVWLFGHLFIYFTSLSVLKQWASGWLGSVWVGFAWFSIRFEIGCFYLFLITLDKFISVSNGFIIHFHFYALHLRRCEDACAFPPSSFNFVMSIFGSMAFSEIQYTFSNFFSWFCSISVQNSIICTPFPVFSWILNHCFAYTPQLLQTLAAR